MIPLLFEIQRILKIIVTESRIVVARGSKKEKWKVALQWVEFQFYKFKRVLEIGFPTVDMLNSELYA